MRNMVCIVDDDGDMREVLTRIVRSAGLVARSFDSAESFLLQRKDVSIGCLLIDVELGGMSGVRLLETLADGGVDFPVFLISGAHDAATMAAANNLGAAIIDKPFDARLLAQRIRAVVGGDATSQ